MNQWLPDVEQALLSSSACVVVTVACISGSAPREAGTRMVVTTQGIHGTIGGGALEYQAIQIARERLTDKSDRERKLLRVPLGAGLGQCCGGVVWLLLERVEVPIPTWIQQLRRTQNDCRSTAQSITMATRCEGNSDVGRLLQIDGTATGSLGSDLADREAKRQLRQLPAGSTALINAIDGVAGGVLLESLALPAPAVVLFGAGHVGTALVKTLAPLHIAIDWVDNRPGIFPESLPPLVRAIATRSPEAQVTKAVPMSCFLVMTHQHPLDFRLIVAIFRRGDFAFCGLIGSASKRLRAERQLRNAGIGAAIVSQRLTCPIGIGDIRSKQPAAIAITVAAQLLQVRESLETASQAEPPPMRLENL